jgi:hypothetical protein
MAGMIDDDLTHDSWTDLARFPWLTPVTRRIEDVVASYEQALHVPARAATPEGLHMLLVAPRGLGRFRLASALGTMLFDRGHMRDNRVNVTFATDLVSKYIGQTRLATLGRCEPALDAMLLMQYADELAGHAFSQEAVDTLIKFMDASKRRIVIVMILEPGEVPKFAATFPELLSRFHRIEFPIPNPGEQIDFLCKLANRGKHLLPNGIDPLLGPWIERRMPGNDWEYMRQIGHLLGWATYAWAERTGAPRGPDRRYQIPEGINLERRDFEWAMAKLDGTHARATA